MEILTCCLETIYSRPKICSSGFNFLGLSDSGIKQHTVLFYINNVLLHQDTKRLENAENRSQDVTTIKESLTLSSRGIPAGTLLTRAK